MKSIDKNNLIMVSSVDLSQFSDDTVNKMAESVSESERKGIFNESKPFDVIGKYTREIMWKKGDSEFLYLD